ncbi:dsRBD fold-containing protein [Longispora albida]|uniref:dsRBD fold-containing protein n=1 Tax=Longispora albida TaxID=203523 RepID=UPI0003671D72|nr:dsRBD fold-containing protein [Longispora albida]
MSTAVMTRWTVELTFDEDPDHTIATATLRIPNGQQFTSRGHARRHPKDRPAATIGEELAGARALSALAHDLLEYSATEVEHNARRGPGR